MKLKEMMTESFKTVSINGILYSLNNDEKELYKTAKIDGKLYKKDLDEFNQRIANEMVSKGLLHRKKDKDSNIYFTTKGRRKIFGQQQLTEVAPPDKESEKWINDNKEKFKEKYGKDYEKYLYGKAWNLYNGKSLKEGYVKQKSNFANTDVKYDDDYIDFEVGMTFVDPDNIHWNITNIQENKNGDKIVWAESEDGRKDWDTQENLNTDLMLDKIHMVFDPKFFSKEDTNYGSNNETLEEEISPSRLWKYQEHPEMNFAILSADRNERTPEENKQKSEELKKDIKSMGYWYTELKGGYVEIGENGKRIPVDGEDSFIIPNMTKEEAMELGKKYDQDTVMYKDAKAHTLQYIITNERVGNVGDPDSSFETQAGKDNFSVSSGNDLDYYSRLPKSNKKDLKIGFNWKE